MRELKYRAWDKVEKKMLFDADPFAIYVSGSNEPLLAETHRNEDCIFEQYTCLKDKNGKKIYEGDIVEAFIDGVWDAGNAVCFGKKKWKLEVIYNDIRFMDVFRVIGSKNCPDRIYYLFDKELSELEVIGNVHENPEFLEVKDVD